jgi:hypothetical protein
MRMAFVRKALIIAAAAAVILYLVFLRVELALEHQAGILKAENEQGFRAQAIPGSQPLNCRSGEKIVYDIKMGKLTVGESVFENFGRSPLAGKDAVRVVFRTRLPRFSDTETIYADVNGFLPLRVERDVAMWPKHEQIVEEYDQQAFRLTITKRSGKPDVIEKTQPMHNAILLPYQVRCFGALEPGWRMPVNLPTQTFEITLKRIEEVRVPAGTFRAYYFESVPERFAIWVSADERRLPVKIRGSGGIGYTMVMKSFE